MKNSKWLHGLLLMAVLWSSNTQASPVLVSDSANSTHETVGSFEVSAPSIMLTLMPGNLIQVGSLFDIQVAVFSPFWQAEVDELILGFGLNAELSGTGSAQFLGRSVNSLFDDISTQDGVNLSAAGLAFPGLSSDDTGTLLSLAVLHFQAITVGDLNIAISSDLNDFNQGLIYLNQPPLAIQANTNLTIAAVPLPPSVILFASAGLLMLTGRRKLAENR
ncbi:MAG: hypothetical protein CTY19_07320 [Methylomonas sp.]|nr:MAG: hypothetical protein CTY19_07320 [Methylomonas sp.]